MKASAEHSLSLSWQHTTLTAMVERALSREMAPHPERDPDTSALFEVGPIGILGLKNFRPNPGLDEPNRTLEEIED